LVGVVVYFLWARRGVPAPEIGSDSI